MTAKLSLNSILVPFGVPDSNLGGAVHQDHSRVIIGRSGDGELEFFPDGVDTNDNLPGHMDVVDPGLSDGKSFLPHGVQSHHTVGSLSHHVDLILEVPEDGSPRLASLDGSLQVESHGHGSVVSQRQTNDGGLFIKQTLQLDSSDMVDIVLVSHIHETRHEFLQTSAFTGRLIIVRPGDDGGSLDHDTNVDLDRLVSTFPDAHVLLQDLVQDVGLPGARIHALELPDQALGHTFDPQVNVQSVGLVRLEESVGDRHAQGDRGSGLVGANHIVSISSTITILLLLVFPDIGLGNSESPVSFVLAVLLHELQEVLGPLANFLMTRIDGVGKLVEDAVGKVDDFVVGFGLEDGQDASHVSGGRVAVEDHGQSRDPGFVVLLLVGKDGEEVVDAILDSGIPSSNPNSSGFHFGLFVHLSIKQRLDLISNTSVTDILQGIQIDDFVFTVISILKINDEY